MSQHCHGNPKCDASQFCECLPEGVVAGASATTKKEGFKVVWCGMTAAHCRTPEAGFGEGTEVEQEKQRAGQIRRCPGNHEDQD